MKKYYCIKCKVNEINYKTALYGSGLCRSCSHLGHKVSKQTRNKISKSSTGYKCAEETKSKISKALTGIKHTKERIEKNRQSHLGKTRTKEQKQNMSKALKNRKLSEQNKLNIAKSLKGIKHSKERRKNISLGHGGTGIPYENKDLTFSIRLLPEYFEWRTKVFERDNYTCQECGQIGDKLEAHHIKQFAIILKEFLNKYNQYSPIEDKQTLINLAINYKDFWNINNGQTLCKACHDLTRQGRFPNEE